MARDYKQQMWLMTDGLGEWMTRQEMRRRRRRRVAMVIGGLVIVTLAVLGVMLLLFPRNVNHYHQHNVVNHYYGTEATTEPWQTNPDSATNITYNYFNTDKSMTTEPANHDAVTIDKKGIVVKDADGEEVHINLNLEDLIKKYSKE